MFETLNTLSIKHKLSVAYGAVIATFAVLCYVTFGHFVEVTAQVGTSNEEPVFSKTVIAMTAVFIITLVAAIAYTFISIVYPIVNIRANMRVLQDNEVQKVSSYMDRQDEIGRLAQAVHFMKVRVHIGETLAEGLRHEEEGRDKTINGLAEDFEAQIQKFLTDMSAATTQLQNSSEAMSLNANYTISESVQLEKATYSTTENVETVAVAAEQLSHSIREIYAQIEKSKDIVSHANKEAAQSSGQAKKMALLSERMELFIELITEIASQTNHFARHAAIESARIGGDSEVFEFVSKKLKDLSWKANHTAQEMAEQIRDVHEASITTAEAVNEFANIVQEVNEISSGVAAAMEQQTSATQEIVDRVIQAANRNSEVNARISSVHSTANETEVESKMIRTTAEDLEYQSKNMANLVNSFVKQVKNS